VKSLRGEILACARVEVSASPTDFKYVAKGDTLTRRQADFTRPKGGFHRRRKPSISPDLREDFTLPQVGFT